MVFQYSDILEGICKMEAERKMWRKSEELKEEFDKSRTRTHSNIHRSRGYSLRFVSKKITLDVTESGWGKRTNLGPPAPHHFSARRHQTQLAHIDLNYGALCQHSQVRVHWVLRVLLYADDGQLHRDGELGVGDVGALVAEPHRSDESFIFHGAAGEVGSN